MELVLKPPGRWKLLIIKLPLKCPSVAHEEQHTRFCVDGLHQVL